MTLAESILKYFVGRAGVIAVSDDKAFRPVEYTIKPSWIESEHLGGKRCLGYYLLDADSNTRTVCVDFDNHPNDPNQQWKTQAETLYYHLANIDLHPLVEISASGNGAHVWLFLDKPTPAYIPRAFIRGAADSIDLQLKEIYPRQDRLAGKGLGNLVRYPLWNKSQFVNVENDWNEIEPVEALASIRTTDSVTLKMLAFDLGQPELKPAIEVSDDGKIPHRIEKYLARKHTLLARRWAGDVTSLKDKSRSALVLSIACELVRLYVPTSEISQTIKCWCDEHGYDKGNREDWIARTVQKAYEFVTTRIEKKSSEATEMVHCCYEYLDTLKAGGVRHFQSGIDVLDDSIDGVAPGEMCVIAARPSHGKSIFALQWLQHIASCGYPTLFISEEMSKPELGKRALCSITSAEQNNWQEIEAQIRDDATDYYSEHAPIYVHENCNTIQRCEELIDFYCRVNDVKAVVVDYLQLLGSRAASRYETVTEISRGLKQSAMRNSVAVFALSQLNRSIEKRDQHTPKLSDLRESGQIEQDSDLVLFLDWPNKYDHAQDPMHYRIYAAKRRNGPIRDQVIDTTFNADRQRFGNIRDMPNFSPEFN